MKYILSVEVDAPANLTNDNFPEEVHASMWLEDQLRCAITQRLWFIMKNDGRSKHYINSQRKDIKLLENCIRTIRLVR